jgi:EAL domain-containing protein (putative c-di-GMP-specific phosphodiesterase class I)
LLKRHDLAADLLDLEISESPLMASFDGRGSGNLFRLAAMGVKISIDDLGIGRLSLSELKRLPIDHIKLAATFVDGIGRSSEDEAIVRALITLGHSLDKRIIAGGVATEAQRLFLSQLGCDYAQGRLFGDAMTAEEIGPSLAAGWRPPVTTPMDPGHPTDVRSVRAKAAADLRKASGRQAAGAGD